LANNTKHYIIHIMRIHITDRKTNGSEASWCSGVRCDRKSLGVVLRTPDEMCVTLLLL